MKNEGIKVRHHLRNCLRARYFEGSVNTEIESEMEYMFKCLDIPNLVQRLEEAFLKISIRNDEDQKYIDKYSYMKSMEKDIKKVKSRLETGINSVKQLQLELDQIATLPTLDNEAKITLLKELRIVR